MITAKEVQAMNTFDRYDKAIEKYLDELIKTELKDRWTQINKVIRIPKENYVDAILKSFPVATIFLFSNSELEDRFINILQMNGYYIKENNTTSLYFSW